MKRVFAAIDISDEARQSIETCVRDLRQVVDDLKVKWEPAEKLHITVKFAGSIDDGQLRDFSDVIAKAAARFSPFRVWITGTGAFIRPRRSNVLWLGLESEDNKLEALGTVVEELYGTANEESRKRTFKPHLTIARLKEPQSAKPLIDKHLTAEFRAVEFEASELIIYESTLLPAGSVYSKLEGFFLKGST